MEKNIEGHLIKHSRSLGCLLVAFFFLVIFLLNLFRLIEPAYRFNSFTEGVVVRKDLGTVYQSSGSDDGGMDWAWVPHIEYSYEVNGEKFVGDKFSSSERGGTQKNAERILESYEIGTAVTVFYQFGSPQESVLRPKPTTEALNVTYGIGVIGILLTLLSIFIWRKDSTKEFGP